MKNHSFSKIVKIWKIAWHAGENAKIKVRAVEMSSQNRPKNVSNKAWKHHWKFNDFLKVLGGVLVPKSILKSIKKSIEFLMDFWIDFGWILGGFWDHFGSQNGIQKSMKFRMRFRRPKQGGPWFFGVGPAECAGSLGGIIGGYKDPKIAGESRTRAKEIQIGV